jgi:NitT/TauT family transport system substrate-binding protein
MNPKSKNLMVVAVVLSLFLIAFGQEVAAKEKVKIGACVSWPGYSFYELVREKNMAPDYDIEVSIMEDPLGGHAMLAAGQLDIYACTLDYISFTIESDLPVTNVAYTNPSYGVDQITLAPGIEPQNLKGKKVSAPQAYIGQLLMGLWLDKHGITPKDVSWVNLNADEAVGPMLSGDISAAYMYEPWVSKLIASMPGCKSVANTSEPYFLEKGMFGDSIYMNKNFIKNRRKAALDMLRARWDAVGYWHDHTDETNKFFAKYLDWPVADVEAVMGTNGKYLLGGNYMFDFDESARFCGVLDGEPGLGQKHGGFLESVKTTNEWWVKLGVLKKVHDPAKGVDCSLMEDLLKEGYRQSFSARK